MPESAGLVSATAPAAQRMRRSPRGRSTSSSGQRMEKFPAFSPARMKSAVCSAVLAPAGFSLRSPRVSSAKTKPGMQMRDQPMVWRLAPLMGQRLTQHLRPRLGGVVGGVAPRRGDPCFAPVTMTAPGRPRAIMRGTQVRAPGITPQSFMSSVHIQSSSGPNRLHPGWTPAFSISTSVGPRHAGLGRHHILRPAGGAGRQRLGRRGQPLGPEIGDADPETGGGEADAGRASRGVGNGTRNKGGVGHGGRLGATHDPLSGGDRGARQGPQARSSLGEPMTT